MINLEFVLSVSAGLVAAFKWTYEYSEKLKWEKNKLLLDELEKFGNLSSTKAMEKILDWSTIIIDVDNKSIQITNEVIYYALQTHDIKQSFTGDEVKLRGIFDDYFDNLTKLVYMTKTNLIPKSSLILFMNYWFLILIGKNKNKPEKVIKQLHSYLEFYGYKELLTFLKGI